MMLALIYGLNGQIKTLSLIGAEAVKKWHNGLKATVPLQDIYQSTRRTAGKIHRLKRIYYWCRTFNSARALTDDDVGVMFDDATIKGINNAIHQAVGLIMRVYAMD